MSSLPISLAMSFDGWSEKPDQLSITGRKDIEPLADEAKQRLERALAAI